MINRRRSRGKMGDKRPTITVDSKKNGAEVNFQRCLGLIKWRLYVQYAQTHNAERNDWTRAFLFAPIYDAPVANRIHYDSIIRMAATTKADTEKYVFYYTIHLHIFSIIRLRPIDVFDCLYWKMNVIGASTTQQGRKQKRKCKSKTENILTFVWSKPFSRHTRRTIASIHSIRWNSRAHLSTWTLCRMAVVFFILLLFMCFSPCFILDIRIRWQSAPIHDQNVGEPVECCWCRQ